MYICLAVSVFVTGPIDSMEIQCGYLITFIVICWYAITFQCYSVVYKYNMVFYN